MALLPDHLRCDIPFRLWTKKRPNKDVVGDDVLYIRHPAKPVGEAYEFSIPGHDHLEDQSANSKRLNVRGTPRDVLFNTEGASHHWEMQVAALDVAEVVALELPNNNTIQRAKDGSIKKHADRFSFEVVHAPTMFMYPHCQIEARRNGGMVKDVPKSMRTAIKARFALLAEKNRMSMNPYYRPGEPVHCPVWLNRLRVTVALLISRASHLVRRLLPRR